MKKLVSIILGLSLFFTCTASSVFASDDGLETIEIIPAKTDEQSVNVEVSAKSAVLMDGSSKKVLFEKNSHEKLPLASVTKIMTLLLVMEYIESGALHMEDMLTTSTHASQMGGSQIWLKEGEQMTVQDLLKATAVGSANDAAAVLAEEVGKTQEGFVMLMNSKALQLGMKDTSFKNPTGLDEEGHFSSAYDIALMSKALLEKKDIKAFTTIWMGSLRDGKTQLVNTNKLVRFYKGTTGLKTGTTDGAGSCISATATRGEMDLISVVMGCKTSAERFTDARRILEYGFSHYMMYNIKASKEKLQAVKVIHGTKDEVPVKCEIGKSIMIPAGKEKSVVEEINLPKSKNAPILLGEPLGTIKISIDSQVIADFEIKASEAVDQMTFKNAFIYLLKKLACD